MTSKMILAVSASALSLALTPLAQAAPKPAYPEADYMLRTAPPPANPHDVFRTTIRVPRSTAQAAASCDCPMKAGAGMAEHCMNRG